MCVIYETNIYQHWGNSKGNQIVLLPLFVAYTHFSSFLASFLASLPHPMPCMVVPSCTPVSSLWNAKNWLYPAIERLEVQYKVILYINGSVLVGNTSIMVSVVVTAYLYAGIPQQDIASLLSVLPWTSCLGQTSFSKIYLNHGSQLVDIVVIFN